MDTSGSDPLRLLNGALIVEISGVLGRGGFEEENASLPVAGDGAVFFPTRDDAKVAFGELKVLLFPQFDGEGSVQDEKELIRRVVVVPVEGPFQFGKLNVLIIQFTNDAGRPLLVKLAQFFA